MWANECLILHKYKHISLSLLLLWVESVVKEEYSPSPSKTFPKGFDEETINIQYPEVYLISSSILERFFNFCLLK